MTNEAREALALQIVTTLPRYGSWVSSFREFDTPHGHLGYRQLAILWLMRYQLLTEEDWTPTRIASFHRVQPSVVTRALDKLENGGFVTRTHDTLDRRRVNLAITEKGIEVSQYVERMYLDDIVGGLASLDDDAISELKHNVDVLSDLVRDLEERRAERRSGEPDHELDEE